MTPRSSDRSSVGHGCKRRNENIRRDERQRTSDAERRFLTTLDDRAVSQLVGGIALLAITVALVAVVAVGASTWSLESPPPTATFDLTVDGEQSTVAIDHVGGEAVDVTQLTVRIAVDGEELAEQPSVPFVGAAGFDGAPTGPFNAATDSEWRAGEQASVTVAGTNDPGIESGDSVTVTLVVDDSRVATLEETAT